jgi:hypothetical protein
MHRRRRGSLGLTVVLVAAVPVAAGAAAPVPRVEAVPVPAPTAARVAGDPTPEDWARAPTVDAFVERAPIEGGTPDERTLFQVEYDATTLFVRVQALDDHPNRIVGYLTRRDADSPSDWIRVLIDSYPATSHASRRHPPGRCSPGVRTGTSRSSASWRGCR